MMINTTPLDLNQPLPMQQQQQQSQQSAPMMGDWRTSWLKKGATVVLSALALLISIISTISLGFTCIMAGIILVLCSLTVLAMELPVCFSSVALMQPVLRFSEDRPFYQRAAIYLGPAVIALLLCQSVSTILASLCLLAVATLYYKLSIKMTDVPSSNMGPSDQIDY